VVLAIGLPTVIPLEVSVIRAHVDHTVVSVGPYRFHSSQTACDQLVGEILGQGFATDQCLERRPAVPARLQEQAPSNRGGLHHGGTVPFKEGA